MDTAVAGDLDTSNYAVTLCTNARALVFSLFWVKIFLIIYFNIEEKLTSADKKVIQIIPKNSSF